VDAWPPQPSKEGIGLPLRMLHPLVDNMSCMPPVGMGRWSNPPTGIGNVGTHPPTVVGVAPATLAPLYPLAEDVGHDLHMPPLPMDVNGSSNPYRTYLAKRAWVGPPTYW
jgi:hypothetical protein